jgi:hypothetical protein
LILAAELDGIDLVPWSGLTLIAIEETAVYADHVAVFQSGELRILD